MTAAEVASKFRHRATVVDDRLADQVEALRTEAEEFCRKKLLAEVYAIPEDTTASGKKKWERTRDLLAGEQGVIERRFTVKMTNDQPYATARHDAGKPGKRHINKRRESHWRDEMVAEFQPRLAELYRTTLLAALRGR